MDAVHTGQFFFYDFAYQWISVHGKNNFRIGDFFDDLAQSLIYMSHRFTKIFTAMCRQENDAVMPEIDSL